MGVGGQRHAPPAAENLARAGIRSPDSSVAIPTATELYRPTSYVRTLRNLLPRIRWNFSETQFLGEGCGWGECLSTEGVSEPVVPAYESAAMAQPIWELDYIAGNQWIAARTSEATRNVSVLHGAHTGDGAHPAWKSMNNGSAFSEGKAAWTWS